MIGIKGQVLLFDSALSNKLIAAENEDHPESLYLLAMLDYISRENSPLQTIYTGKNAVCHSIYLLYLSEDIITVLIYSEIRRGKT